MLPQQTIASIAKLIKVDAAVLTAAIAAKEEVPIKVKVKDAAGKDVEQDANIDALLTFTSEEITARDTQMKSEGQSTQTTAAKEILIKELKKKFGVEFDGKDPDILVQKVSEKIKADLKLPADARVTELENQLRLLRENGAGNEAKVKELENQLSSATLDSKILANFPKRNADITDEDYLMLTKARIRPETIDGKVVYKDVKGEVFRDPKTATPLDLKGSIDHVFAQNTGWAPKDAKGGRGDGSSQLDKGAGAVPTSMSEAMTQWKALGNSPNSADFSTYLSKLQTENKDFKMDLDVATQTAVPST